MGCHGLVGRRGPSRARGPRAELGSWATASGSLVCVLRGSGPAGWQADGLNWAADRTGPTGLDGLSGLVGP